MKFGGTSVGSAERIEAVASLVIDAARQDRVGVVISAAAGVTNLLVDSARNVARGESVRDYVERYRSIHNGIIDTLSVRGPDPALEQAAREIASLCEDYRNLLHGVRLLGECSASVLDRVSSLGEQASVTIMKAVLQRAAVEVEVVDPRTYVITDDRYGNANPIYTALRERFAPLLESSSRVLLMAGFYGGTTQGRITTLGRGGSDFSASIMADALRADVLEIWTDVDGVFSADPSLVSEAFLLDEVSYEEALELSFFGAKVLHPRTLAPLLRNRIPIWIRNSFRPTSRGTLIHTPAQKSPWVVRGISTLSGLVMIEVSGAGLRGSTGVAARVFQTMSREGISVIFISQASSEASITFAVPRDSGMRATMALEAEFELERSAGQVNAISMIDDLAILSIVGDDMQHKRGIAGTFFSALGAADVNVVAIAQGPSERNISVVIQQSDQVRGMRAAHQFFFNTRQQIQLFLIGVGTVGSQLLDQIARQQARLLEQQVELKVCGVSNSRSMLIDMKGLDVARIKNDIVQHGVPCDLEEMRRSVREARLLDPVWVDCTASEQIANSYLEVFDSGLHIVTANKKANAGPLAYYSQLRRAAASRKRRFLYETNVGAGLPIIETLQNLIHSGDRLVVLQGILSGSLSFILGLLDDGIPFSKAIHLAREKGFTEPDPRDDLGGTDVGRKLLILAREAGYRLELRDVQVEAVLPQGFDVGGTVEDFMTRTTELDAVIQERVSRLAGQGKALRYLARIDQGNCSVGLAEVSIQEPLYHVRGGENAVSLLTERYNPIPLVVRGYGAGPAVTAAGVFANVLQTVFWNSEAV